MRTLLRAVGFLLVLHAGAAAACGHCVEDKVAAVYDYSVMSQAHAEHHHVAFLAIDGDFVPSDSLQREIGDAVRAENGVDIGSVRVSLDAASLSFSFDPRHASFESLQQALDSKLASKKLHVLELKFMDDEALAKPFATQ